MRLNVGSKFASSFQATVYYDTSKLILENFTIDLSLSLRLNLQPQINDPPGTIVFAAVFATPVPNTQNIASVIFKIVGGANTPTTFSGYMDNLFDDTLPIAKPLVNIRTPLMALRIPVFILSSRRSVMDRSLDNLPEWNIEHVTVTHRRFLACAVPPCEDSECLAPREQGDTDGNCMFDINDLTYLFNYYVSSLNDFSTVEGLNILKSIIPGGNQLKSMDADMSGSINVQDVEYLGTVLLGYRVFFKKKNIKLNPTVYHSETDITLENCGMLLSVDLAYANGAPILSSNKTKVFSDITLDNLSKQQQLLKSDLLAGSFAEFENFDGISIQKGSSLTYGAIIDAIANGNGSFFTLNCVIQ